MILRGVREFGESYSLWTAVCYESEDCGLRIMVG